jgi:hypothetical protein
MDHQQAGFEELIASSLASLDQVHRNQSKEDTCCMSELHGSMCWPLPKSSWNIDDFLAHYTPQHSSIRDFMLGHDDNIACIDTAHHVLFTVEYASPNDHFSPSACNDVEASLQCTESNASTPVLNQQLEAEEEQTTVCKVIEKAVQPKRNPVSSKRGRPKLLVEDRDERRRSQNREAQRRFREKHMAAPNRGDHAQ